jgi:penicillin amidase
MKRIGQALIVILVVLLIVSAVLAGVGTWFVRRPWPQVSGTLTVAGLSEPVRVIRDQWGIPHIYAENEHDLTFAQGYVHAQDRLWQMDFNRRVASGALSDACGDATLEIDRFMRTLGLRRAAEKDWEVLDDDTRVALEAYAEGVNAYIDSHRDRLPLEFTILGADPVPWTPIDSIAIGKVMAYSLSANYEFELLRSRIIAELGEEAAQQLLPPYPDGAPVIIPPEARSYAWLREAGFDALDSVSALVGRVRLDRGSNSWVIDGSRTETGDAMLANDTHLGLDMPSIWYENGLHGAGFDTVGFIFPGIPLVVIGHNANIAWGVTNLPADVQDFYIERLDDPDNPRKYEFMREWRDLEVVRETIDVKDCEPEVIDVLITHHGPIMNEAIGAPEDADPLALQWTALDGTQIIRSVRLLDLASNWEEFREAVSYWDVPSQNLVYADVQGNIGYQTPGKIPVRAPGHQGLVPVPGWTGEYEWQGYIPYDELPSVLNPPTGFLVTANNKVVPDDYPNHLAYEWSAPYRAQRIVDLLAADESVSIQDSRDIQADTYSLPAEALRPYMLAVEPDPSSGLQATAQNLLAEWDLHLEADRTGASVYQAWLWFLLENTFGDELGEELLAEYIDSSNMSVPLLIDIMEEAENAWFDDVTTSEVETRDDILRRSLADGVAWLSERHGADPDKWEWGRLHTKTFVHNPLGQSGIGLLEDLFNSNTIQARGDSFTVDAAWFSFVEPFAMTGGASNRQIVDLGNLSNSLGMHTTGQSGQLLHRHREDFVWPWQNVEYHSVLFDQEATIANSEAILNLTPP